jgi:hypothetical protein
MANAAGASRERHGWRIVPRRQLRVSGTGLRRRADSRPQQRELCDELDSRNETARRRRVSVAAFKLVHCVPRDSYVCIPWGDHHCLAVFLCPPWPLSRIVRRDQLKWSIIGFMEIAWVLTCATAEVVREAEATGMPWGFVGKLAATSNKMKAAQRPNKKRSSTKRPECTTSKEEKGEKAESQNGVAGRKVEGITGVGDHLCLAFSTSSRHLGTHFRVRHVVSQVVSWMYRCLHSPGDFPGPKFPC